MPGHRMILRSSNMPSPWSWLFLPTEIRLMILEIVAYDKYPRWASLASVSREWQSVLETSNFYKLKIQVPCLEDLETISPQRKRLVHHIWLDIELPEYASTCCPSQSLPAAGNSAFASDAIWKIFSVLSNWEQGANLTLELNIHSPSDSQHWFKNMYFSSDHVEDTYNEDTTQEIDSITFHDPRHGWFQGQQIKPPPQPDMLRLFRPIVLTFPETLPRVKVVTCLIIRRQLRRCIYPWGIGLLASSLDRLDHMVYEPWASYEGGEFDEICLGFALRNQIPSTVRTLCVFEDSQRFYDALPPRLFQPHHLHLYGQGGWLDPGHSIEATFAYKSRELQHLAVSFIVNAEEVFRNCRKIWTWPQLESLALTSQLMQDEYEYFPMIDSLICQAAVIVRRMPKIHTFVLWNGGRQNACAFIFRMVRDDASITWRGSWRWEMTPRALERWQLTASTLSSSDRREGRNWAK